MTKSFNGEGKGLCLKFNKYRKHDGVVNNQWMQKLVREDLMSSKCTQS